MTKGFKPPFRVVNKGVYTRIVDREYSLVVFMGMSDEAKYNAQVIVDLLNDTKKRDRHS